MSKSKAKPKPKPKPKPTAAVPAGKVVAADDGSADTPKAIAKAASKARAKRLAGYQL